jgi:hypothetical protein
VNNAIFQTRFVGEAGIGLAPRHQEPPPAAWPGNIRYFDGVYLNAFALASKALRSKRLASSRSSVV